MNLVDMLKDQLAGEVGKKLGGMVGASELDMGKIVGAGLPSVLAGLGTIASNKIGADKLAKSIGGIDSSNFGDLGKMLSSSTMSSGGNMLSGLMGGSLVDGIANTIAKFTGINVTIVKTALGYLTPLVLGSVGSSFKGAKPDGAGIAKLFSEQKNNIAAAMPAGLSLNGIPGFQALAGNVANTASKATAEASSGLGKLLVPGAIIAALIGAVIFFMNSGGNKAVDSGKGTATGATKSIVNDVKNQAANIVDQSQAAIPELPGADAIKTSITGMMDGLFTNLDSIKDSTTAEAALPALKEIASKFDGVAPGINALPNEQKTVIGGIIKSQLEKLDPIIERISAIPGIGDAIKQVLTQLKEKLAGFVG